MFDKYSGRSRRFAFVTAKTVEDANSIVEKLNGTVSVAKVHTFILIKILLKNSSSIKYTSSALYRHFFNLFSKMLLIVKNELIPSGC